MFCSKFNFDSIFKVNFSLRVLRNEIHCDFVLRICFTFFLRSFFLWWQPMKWKLECFSVFSQKSDRICEQNIKYDFWKTRKLLNIQWQQRKVKAESKLLALHTKMLRYRQMQISSLMNQKSRRNFKVASRNQTDEHAQWK